MTKIKEPIFIIGASRSGTTFMHRILSGHPDIGTIKSPNIKRKYRSILDEIFNFSPYIKECFGKIFNVKIIPIEGKNIWTFRFFDDSDVLTEKDSSFLREYIVKKIMLNYLEYYNKKRFLAKEPSLSFKIRYISKLFPDAFFVHIYRDGRAVVNSAKKMWERGRLYSKWWGTKPDNWKKIREINNLTLICANQWIGTIEYINKNKSILKKRIIEIKYEELVNNFEGATLKVLDFLNLDCSDEYNGYLKKLVPKNMNWKWKEELKENDIKLLDDFKEFNRMMSLLGYK
jgi:hypothetical protein